MKKLLSLLIVAFLISGMQAQDNRAFVPEEVFNTTVTRTYHFAPENQSSNNRDNITQPNRAEAVKATQNNMYTEHYDLGETYMDRQTYGAARQQTYQYADGYSVAVWTLTKDFEGEFEDIGTAYSYKTETWSDWAPQPGEASRIESVKSRYPSYAPFGENGEVVVSQQNEGLNIYTREEKGVGEWDHQLLEPSGDIPALKYPHMITSGENHQILHIAAVTNAPYDGQKSALLYFRSPDGGQTWDQQSTLLEGTGSEHYTAIYGDTYNFASTGDTVALAVSSPWHDTFFLQSEDNGESWQKHVVWEHPYPMFDFESTITTDTLWCPGGSMDAVYDELHRLHIAFDLTRVMHEETGYEFTHFPWTDGIIQWDETLEPFSRSNQHKALSYDNLELTKHLVGWSVDQNNNNVFDDAGVYNLGQYPHLGMSTMPSFSRQSNNYTIALSYLSPNEERNNGENFYRNVYVKPYYFTPLTDTLRELGNTGLINENDIFLFNEVLYPQLPPWNDSYIFIQSLYHGNTELYFPENDFLSQVIISEYEPAFGWSNPLPIVNSINQSTFTEKIRVSQNHPNPFSDQTQIEVKLPGAMIIELNVRNLKGKSVFNCRLRGGLGNNQILIPAGNLKSGVYLYTITAGEETVTRKMMVR